MRAVAASIDLHVWPSCHFADLAGILGRQRQGHVSGDGCDAEYLQFGAGEGQQDGNGVVLAGVGVDDDRARGVWLGHGARKPEMDRRGQIKLPIWRREEAPKWDGSRHICGEQSGPDAAGVAKMSGFCGVGGAERAHAGGAAWARETAWKSKKKSDLRGRRLRGKADFGKA